MPATTILDAERLREIFKDCMFRDGEDTENRVEVEGIMNRFGFHPERLKSHQEEIAAMLAELPDDFMRTKGGGMSFLNACYDRHGNHWAEHPTMDMLFSIGTAIGRAKCVMPRAMWSVLPGGMPYYQVENEPDYR